MFKTLFCLALALAAATLPAQGGRTISGTSPDGRFRVHGHTILGFDYRFETRQPDGSWRRTAWVKPDYSSYILGVAVSPTGNGFLLCEVASLRLLSPDGRILNQIVAPAGHGFGSFHFDTAKLLVTATLHDAYAGWPGSLPLGEPVRRVRVFVPTGCAVGHEEEHRFGEWRSVRPIFDHARPDWLRRMLHWSPRIGRRQTAEAEDAIRVLRGDDSSERRNATRTLVTLGLSAIVPLESELTADFTSSIRTALDRIRHRLYGHGHPHRDLALLAALAKHPDLDLAATARSRLRRILPKALAVDAARARPDLLRWDPARQRYDRR